MMKGWMKCGLAGAVVLMASFWGGSVRAAGIELKQPEGTNSEAYSDDRE